MPAYEMRLSAERFADRLVARAAESPGGAALNESQLALSSWLNARAGLYSACYEEMPVESEFPGERTRRTCDAAARFGQLPAAVQRRWLERHYADLRAGRLSLEDLP